MELTDDQLINVLKTKIIIDSNGSKFYMLNNIFHREDGPAVIYAKELCFPIWQRWYLYGKEYSEEEFNDLKVIASSIKK